MNKKNKKNKINKRRNGVFNAFLFKHTLRRNVVTMCNDIHRYAVYLNFIFIKGGSLDG